MSTAFVAVFDPHTTLRVAKAVERKNAVLQNPRTKLHHALMQQTLARTMRSALDQLLAQQMAAISAKSQPQSQPAVGTFTPLLRSPSISHSQEEVSDTQVSAPALAPAPVAVAVDVAQLPVSPAVLAPNTFPVRSVSTQQQEQTTTPMECASSDDTGAATKQMLYGAAAPLFRSASVTVTSTPSVDYAQQCTQAAATTVAAGSPWPQLQGSSPWPHIAAPATESRKRTHEQSTQEASAVAAVAAVAAPAVAPVAVGAPLVRSNSTVVASSAPSSCDTAVAKPRYVMVPVLRSNGKVQLTLLPAELVARATFVTGTPAAVAATPAAVALAPEHSQLQLQPQPHGKARRQASYHHHHHQAATTVGAAPAFHLVRSNSVSPVEVSA